MAGEWISMDCCLAQKPEVLEIIGETGEEVGTVLGRLFLFWSWASLNSSDGTVRGSAAILRAVAGGDEAFWKAVERVGWIELGDGTITVGGWENRFSKSAKSRLLANKRQKSKRHASVTHERDTLSRSSVTPCHAPPLHPVTHERDQTDIQTDKLDRGERRGLSSSLSDFWSDFLPIWNKTPKALKQSSPADIEPTGSIDLYWAALERLPKCDYFETGVALSQFFKPGFAERILDGHFDGRNKPHGGTEPDKPPLRAFEGDDAARFAATKAKYLKNLKERA